MGVSRVIISHLLIVAWCILVVSQDVHSSNQTSPLSPLNQSVVSEGGSIGSPTDTTHMGREHMHKVTHKEKTPLPPYEVGQKNDNKTSVPKKDATLPDVRISTSSSTTTTTSTSTTTTTTTTTTMIPPKPTLTIGEDEAPPNPPSKTTLNHTEKHGISIESVTENRKKTDYVVPIVVVILSVPLVAIIFSILYKRGSDWWQHRHYRRMDYLINGMYDS